MAYSIGACFGYMIIVSNKLDVVVSLITDHYPLPQSLKFLSDRSVLITLMVVLIILPASLQKSLGALRFTSIIAMATILYLTICVIAQASWTDSCKIGEMSGYECVNNMCVLQPKHALQTFSNYSSCLLGCENVTPDESGHNLHVYIFIIVIIIIS